jgi:hypothetical protein
MSGAWDYRLQHLGRMSDEHGLFEHALRDAPRLEHGYCTDDNARLLVVTSREPDEGLAHDLSRLALRFVLDAQTDAGLVHNRLAWDGMYRWTDDGSTEDCWGRALWGLGVAAAAHPNPGIRAEASWAFHVSARQRSPFLHAMAFAALGAADLAAVSPDDDVARRLLIDTRELISSPGSSGWPWPERRLTYANGAIAEAMIAIGMVLQDATTLQRGLTALEWLMDIQQSGGHLSVVGVGGRGPADAAPQFDQQPIEVAALADACWRAWVATGEHAWMSGVLTAAEWFEGANDVGSRMYDPRSGGGYDGLTPGGPNLNQGAESTLAYISTMQRARSLRPLALLEPRMGGSRHG